MDSKYHIELVEKALADYFSSEALKVIIKSNLNQDSIFGQFGHNEFHFDNNAIIEGTRYINSQRIKVYNYLLINLPGKAWKAFGCLLHAAHDFYAHTNYIDLLKIKNNTEIFSIDNLDFLDDEILSHFFLYSHTAYFPLDYLISAIPFTGKYLTKYLPENSHAKMNLDSPSSGDNFQWAFMAALCRTKHEYSLIEKFLLTKDRSLLALFTDKEFIE